MGLLPLRRINLPIVIFVLFLFCFFGISYLWLPVTTPEFYRPPYQLLTLPGISPVNDVISATDAKSEKFSTFNALPSFFAISDLVRSFTSDHGYYAQLFAKNIATDTSNITNTFTCVCGRISDVCSCCGTLNVCSGLHTTDMIPSKLCGPLILHSPGDKDAASLCLNLTYIPSKQKVRTASFLVPKASSEGAPPHLPYRFNNTRIQFADIYVPLDSPPVYCVENSRTDPDVAICHHLGKLRYSYDSNTDHKTLFTGCGQVTVWIKRRYKIAAFKEFCFSAHRGASGDLDTGSIREQIKSDQIEKPDIDLPDKMLPKIQKQKPQAPKIDAAPFNVADGHAGNP